MVAGLFMWCFEACEHDIPYLQLPQVHLVCFRCTTHSDEPLLELAVPRCKNSCKIASQWNFCTPESCSYGLSSKCFDLIQLRLPRVTSLISIVQRQQNQTCLARAATFMKSHDVNGCGRSSSRSRIIKCSGFPYGSCARILK